MQRTTTQGTTIVRTAGYLPLLCLLAACAGLEEVVAPPGVSLRNVEVTQLALTGQTFLLGFDVTNPNPFPLPVDVVRYDVRLDGLRFASGSTTAAFSVPARSDGEFAIEVELDLLKTTPALLYLIKDGTERDIPYELSGEFGIDLPYVKPVAFGTRGEIRLAAASFRAQLP
ncbi:MAG: LEA type 2 family protein [Woeseiaceae bacterium]|nr:LEA type 2 family protein [Woeseiaceae bacterium]